VIGLDFGSDTMKVALVQPGAPLEIVTNFQSKRKTPTVISFYRGERMFGSDATALMARKPDLTFAKVYRMIGKDSTHPSIQEITDKHHYPYKIYSNETMSSATCIKQEETFYTPEELMAMLMSHAKEMTANYGGKQIKDCVITVPSHFTQHERRALYSAADIAHLRVLSLIEENTAAALHYGIDRVFDKPHTILYYNMGASSIQVSIVTYTSYQSKEAGKSKTVGQFEVVGKGWDAHLGGFNFDIAITDMLASAFQKIWEKKKRIMMVNQKLLIK
jgi:hypoxia up-regulated 1